MSTSCKLVLWTVALSLSGATVNSAERVRSATDRAKIEVWRAAKAGDLSVIASAASDPESLPLLYDLLHRALIGGPNDAMRDTAAQKIATIPGHAEYLENKITALAGEFTTTPKRDVLIYLLRHIRSKDSLEALGRLLFDNRLPEAALPLESLSLDLPMASNATLVAENLHSFMGKDSPLRQKPGLLPDGVERLQTWWNSPAGRAYRASFSPSLTSK